MHEKKKLGQLDFIKIENFCFSKDTAKRMKRQAADWEKVFAMSILDKALVAGMEVLA